ncbi:MAG: hypothetical protein CMH63_02770 [Nanoarchaeota archaeon]|jgi:hypothetical protein|nr:hypothetical protein [Nanoarchaeota archaeon]|tara:strand:- start:18533 stop:19036 length:504 start_codon:yes stop_codon:yes gene_type:complete
MTKTHQKIIDEIVKKYKKDRKTIAINLFDSLMEGKERPDSDVDIEIVSNRFRKWVLTKSKKYGIIVEIVKCPKKHLFYQIEKYPYLCYEYLRDKILYDPKGFMKDVKKELKLYFNKNTKIAKFWEDELEIMRKNKAKGKDLKNAKQVYDEAEILFSDEHKVTRDFFN